MPVTLHSFSGASREFANAEEERDVSRTNAGPTWAGTGNFGGDRGADRLA
jgi:hypothetical protein